MPDDTNDPIASTAAFRAFSDDELGGAEPTRRRPSPLVYVTSIVLLAALVLGVLAYAL